MAIRRICGVYRIQCKVTGDYYIGGSNHIYQRWLEHRADLRRGVHIAKKLQEDWNRYGADAFEFTILEEVTPGPGLPTMVPWRPAERRRIYWEKPAYNSTDW